MPTPPRKIEHVVVLMLENRSFDHMLGYLRVKKRLAIDGLTGAETNPDPDGNPVTVKPLATTLFPTDLGHSPADVRAQLDNGNQGFVKNYALQKDTRDPTLVMGYHDDTHVWAYDTLATGFAVCDRWFAALPGPTIPNRLFAVAGESGGDTDQPPHGVKFYGGLRTIFDCLDAAMAKAGVDKEDRWEYYFQDLPMLALVEHHAKELLPLVSAHRIRKIGRFFKRAKAGELPALSWIDPNFADVGGSNDDHPPKSDLYDGQQLVKDVYDAIVGGGKGLFAKTLLIVLYDEHGGFYDHVPPPPSGDAAPFDRFGVRVPAVLVSPWIPPGLVDHTERSHASILRTVLDQFAPDERLTPRVDRAPGLADLLSLGTVRATAPVITAPPRPAAAAASRALAGPAASDDFHAAFRAELQRRGLLVDGGEERPRATRVGRRRVARGSGPAVRVREITEPIRILAVHGVGHRDQNPLSWQPAWTEDFRTGLARWTERPVEVEFLAYDDLFAEPPSAADVVKALVKLGWNGLSSVVSDLVERTRGLAEVPDLLRWTAGLVVQWIEDDTLRAATRARVLERFDGGTRWDVVAAHSLGSLICYDAFQSREGKGVLENTAFLTFGSQLGNLFVRGGFGGRIEPLDASFWYHLYNPHDPVFTHSLDVFGDRFRQVLVDTSLPGLLAEHEATAYLSAPVVLTSAFRDIAGARTDDLSSRAFQAVARAAIGPRPSRRALLVGINDYPDPANRLEGCLNDVYLVSAALQELGFDAKEIRTLVNDRATTANIKDRIEWLLDGSEDGHQRVLFYSGHGAQIPDYNAAEEVDHTDECLVPYDFDWSADRAITDKWFASYYAQLPYAAQFIAVFDCCHSGGLTRAGAGRVRGLTPPDDIRHRALRWDARAEQWVPRTLRPWNAEFGHPGRRSKSAEAKAAKRLLGCASDLRTVSRADARLARLRREFRHEGPYMPILLQACREDELAYEYRDGTSSYGAFTYFLVQTMRAQRRRRQSLTFQDLVSNAAGEIAHLYKQTPQLVCPGKRRRESILRVPGRRPTRRASPRKPRRR
jgi:metacaspase-1